jgi:hypothetical protein
VPQATVPALKLKPREPGNLPPRLIVTAVEGWGKTTLGANAPDPFIMMAPDETGYDTLLQHKLVPQVPADIVHGWQDTLNWLDSLARDPQGCKTIVLDALSGFERLCHEAVCAEHFKGDWGDGGFMAYHKGYDLAAGEWRKLLTRLDTLHNNGLLIILLAHARDKPYHNPDGADYDRHVCDVHDKTWGPTHKWADAVFFGTFFTAMTNEKQAERTGKGKAIGGTRRVLYTERRATWDAKNRFGMPESIDLLGGPSASWGELWRHIEKKG